MSESTTRGTTTFAPSVLIDGQTVTPPGWAWVLGFALRGIPWAVEQARRPEFDRGVKEWFRARELDDLREQEANILEELAKVRGRIKELGG